MRQEASIQAGSTNGMTPQTRSDMTETEKKGWEAHSEIGAEDPGKCPGFHFCLRSSGWAPVSQWSGCAVSFRGAVH